MFSVERAAARSRSSARCTPALSRFALRFSSASSCVSAVDSSMYSVSIGVPGSVTKSLTPTMIFSRRSTACWNR